MRRAVLGVVAMLGVVVAASAWAETTLKTGEPAPHFTLTDQRGKAYALSQYRGQVVLLDFWSAKCPVSARYEKRLQEIATTYAVKGVVTLGIDANQNESLALIQQVAAERSVPFPILIDPGNQVADQFGGLTTPHVFVINAEGRVVYQGAVDDAGLKGSGPVTRQYLREALDAALAGRPVATPETEPFGCSIKRVAQ